jgi:glycine/D-amino acid oxidase-like deaminating enzyme
MDPSQIREGFPFVTQQAVAMIHARRCGWLSAQQLGMYLLDRAKEKGAVFLSGRVTDAVTRSDQIETVLVDTDSGPVQVSTRTFVIAAGPFLKDIGAMIGVDLPVFNELHGKVVFNDPGRVISRDAPMMIWEDPVIPYWTSDERRELEADDNTRRLLEEFPGGVHFRPEGGPDSHNILGVWTYDVGVREPSWPPSFKEEYADIVIRGLVRMIPDLESCLGKISRPHVDGGYYCKTKENRPLIGPLPVEGAYVIGALSGFGIMGAMAAGELLAGYVTGSKLPPYAPRFLLTRYQDPDYRKLLETLHATSGQL